MTLYFEFKGKKLKGTESFSYQEAKYKLAKLVEQCIDAHKFSYNKTYLGEEELILCNKILINLKLVKC